MDALHVSRLAARYRLPAGEPDARARLDRVLREILDEALDQALARAGVPAHEEVCIRAVHAPARLRLVSGDAELAAAWSVALADGIRATLDAGGPGVVRYGSRGHAMVDLLTGVAAGDLRRAWAWRQLGLWSAGDAPASALAAEEAARALVSRPESIVATIAEAARAGVLPALAARIVPAAWTALARAALSAASVADRAAVALLESPTPSRPTAPSTASSVDGAAATISPVATPGASATEVSRVVRGSRIARVATSAAMAGMAAEARRALAVLAALEAEPSALRRPVAAALVSAVEREMAGDGDAPRLESPREREVIDRTSSIDRDVGSVRRASDRHAFDDGIVRSEAATAPNRVESPNAPSPTRRDVARDEPPAERRYEAITGETASGDGDARDNVDADERPLPEVRESAETHWGGLLYVVNLITAMGIADELLEAEAFAGRSLRWTLHALALDLLALDPRDPAALAFAGLGPDRDPPSKGEEAATDDESAALAAMAERIAAALHERIARVPAASAREAAATLRDICRRDAAINADPGWIEVRLRLDQVSIDVRRAGLDLDPGWVPWLGAVVRFVYE